MLKKLYVKIGGFTEDLISGITFPFQLTNIIFFIYISIMAIIL